MTASKTCTTNNEYTITGSTYPSSWCFLQSVSCEHFSSRIHMWYNVHNVLLCAVTLYISFLAKKYASLSGVPSQ